MVGMNFGESCMRGMLKLVVGRILIVLYLR